MSKKKKKKQVSDEPRKIRMGKSIKKKKRGEFNPHDSMSMKQKHQMQTDLQEGHGTLSKSRKFFQKWCAAAVGWCCCSSLAELVKDPETDPDWTEQDQPPDKARVQDRPNNTAHLADKPEDSESTDVCGEGTAASCEEGGCQNDGQNCAAPDASEAEMQTVSKPSWDGDGWVRL